MRNLRRQQKKHRINTKDRFISVLKGDSTSKDSSPSWFQRRELFFPLIMIFVFFMIAFVVKILITVQNLPDESLTDRPEINEINNKNIPPTPDSTDSEEEMDYEEAKKIFGNS